jgi:hypothetical protein
MSVGLVVYASMEACLYCVGYSFLACCGFGGWGMFFCVYFVFPNFRMSLDLDRVFLRLFRVVFLEVVVGAVGINCRISDVTLQPNTHLKTNKLRNMLS